MANELQTKLDAILLDKNTNLLPENLKAGITCLGVNGTLESGGSSDYNAKLVPTNGRIVDYITEISAQLDTSSVTDMQYMFDECTNLATIPLLNTSSVTNMSYMLQDCENLTTIPLLNTSSVTSMSYMFRGCRRLTDESLNNILAMCTNATSYTGTKTLSAIGLSSRQATKCTTLSNYQAFTSAGWTTGY